uniref:Uncharacterized protein n=1 Tax=uncultured bacterium fosmid pJB23D10 TaxID=1478061 RepID=A0A0H3U7E3_9BACT|nr:hypothetical protein [uncultured bacterium fosmid pJB23D10]
MAADVNAIPKNTHINLLVLNPILKSPSSCFDIVKKDPYRTHFKACTKPSITISILTFSSRETSSALLPEAFSSYQQVLIPTLLPRRISEVNESPMITISCSITSGISSLAFANTGSKKSGFGFSLPISSEIKIASNIWSKPDNASFLCCALLVPLVTANCTTPLCLNSSITSCTPSVKHIVSPSLI